MNFFVRQNGVGIAPRVTLLIPFQRTESFIKVDAMR
jgi:hypothetical protein